VSDREPNPFAREDAFASEPELDDATERALGEALRCAWAPGEIDPRRHSEILEQALVDPFAPPSAEEARESERLRQALEAGDEAHPDVRLLHALSAATRAAGPASPPAPARARASLPVRRPSKTNVVFASFGAAALAAAAAFALVAGGGAERAAAPSAERLVPSRSTAALFEREFEAGKTTERIDRIASARAHDLRENRYALWGAR
jgi:hypothetical protein